MKRQYYLILLASGLLAAIVIYLVFRQFQTSTSYRVFELRVGGYVNAYYGLHGRWPKNNSEIAKSLSPSEQLLFQSLVRQLHLNVSTERGRTKSSCIIVVEQPGLFGVVRRRYTWEPSPESIEYDTAGYGSEQTNPK